ncbi:alpha-pore-forming cytotoxin MakA [Actinomadura geliboluensis]
MTVLTTMEQQAAAVDGSAHQKAKRTNDKTASSVAALSAITASCHAVVNTQLTVPTKKPTWFDDLNAELNDAKMCANVWINDIATKLTGSIPGHVITYATTYQALSNEMVSILSRYPDARGSTDPHVREVFDLLSGLRGQVRDIISEVDESARRMKEWGTGLQAAHDRLMSGTTSIQRAEAALRTDIDKMTNAIQGLKDQIAAENKQICYAAGTIGVGLFVGVVGLALAPVTGGWSLVVAAGGLLAVAGGAAWWAVMQSKINTQFGQIAADNAQKDDDQRQIIALEGLSLATHSAGTSMEVAEQTLSDVRAMWATFDDELAGTLDKLDKADENLAAIVNKAWILGAQEEWAEALQFARTLSGYQPPLEHQVLHPSAV